MTGINCIKEEDSSYVSLTVSRDSEDFSMKNMKNSIDNLSRKVKEFGAKCQFESNCGSVDPESLLMTEKSKELLSIASVPLSPQEVNHWAEACMGSYEERTYSRDALIGLPHANDLSGKLQTTNIREKLHYHTTRRRSLRFLLPLLIKSEINPLLAISEMLLTWIVVLCGFQAVFNGIGVLGTFFGGFALFGALSIVQFWYGFSHYRTRGADVLRGRAIDDEFEQLRDVCSFYCHGDSRRRNPTASILVSFPFTAVTYLVDALFSALNHYQNKSKDFVLRRSNPSSPTLWGIYSSNVLITCAWLAGGPFWMVFAVFTLLVNQQLYNGLLFRRSFDEFLLSFVFGNFFAINTIGPETSKNTTSRPSEKIVERPTLVREQSSICESAKASSDRNRLSDERDPVQEKMGLFSSLSDDSLFKGIEDDPIIPSTASRLENGQSLGKKGRVYSNNTNGKALNVFDVYFGLEYHPGTQAWRNAVLDATRKLPGSEYDDSKHDFTMRKLKGRKFFSKGDYSEWQQAGDEQIRDACESFFIKQIDMQSQISHISRELHDLKRTKVKSVETTTQQVDGTPQADSLDTSKDKIPEKETASEEPYLEGEQEKNKRKKNFLLRRLLRQPKTQDHGEKAESKQIEAREVEHRNKKTELTEMREDPEENIMNKDDNQKRSKPDVSFERNRTGDSRESVDWQEEASQFLEENEKNIDDIDSTVIKQWVAEQANKRRVRSRFFTVLWNRASKRHQDSVQLEKGPPNTSHSDPSAYAVRLSDASRGEDKEETKEKYQTKYYGMSDTRKMKKETMEVKMEANDVSVVDHLMKILQEDFWKGTNSDMISAQDSDSMASGSSGGQLSSFEGSFSIVDSRDDQSYEGRVDTRSLFEYITDRLNDEFDFYGSKIGLQ